MAKDQGAIPTSFRPRTPTRAAPPEAAPKRRFNPVQFYNEVLKEGRKVSWTTWKETWITSVMVLIMVVLAALFFFGVDALFNFLANWGLNLGKPGQ